MWDVNTTPKDRVIDAHTIFNGHTSVVEVRDTTSLRAMDGLGKWRVLEKLGGPRGAVLGYHRALTTRRWKGGSARHC